MTFCRIMWTDPAKIVAQDVDRDVDALTLAPLELGSGFKACRFENMTLRGSSGGLFENRAVWDSPWIVSQSTATCRWPRRYGQQVCPACLEDRDPHWPLQWRWAFVTCCSRHERLLIDRCAQCGAQLSALQVPSPHHPLRHCRRCCAPLWTARTDACEPGAERLQRLCLDVIERGWFETAGECHVSVAGFFDALHALLLRVHPDGARAGLAPIRATDARDNRVGMRFNGRLCRLNQLSPVARHRLFELLAEVLDRERPQPEFSRSAKAIIPFEANNGAGLS
jgi:hypothetical protein